MHFQSKIRLTVDSHLKSSRKDKKINKVDIFYSIQFYSIINQWKNVHG